MLHKFGGKQTEVVYAPACKEISMNRRNTDIQAGVFLWPLISLIVTVGVVVIIYMLSRDQ
jgi:hypothetical protein